MAGKYYCLTNHKCYAGVNLHYDSNWNLRSYVQTHVGGRTMKVNIYRTAGHLDRQYICTKFFYTADKAATYCKFVAPKLYGYGHYSFTIINR